MNIKIIYSLIVSLFFNWLIITTSFCKVEFCVPNVGYAPSSGPSKSILIEGFETSSDWNSGVCKNETIKLTTVKGISNYALRIEYDFPAEGEWVYISKPIKNVDFKKDYFLSLWLRGNGLPNDIQFQIVDADGGSFVRYFFNGTKTSEWHKEQFNIHELHYGWGGTNATPEPPFRLTIAIHTGLNIQTGGTGWIEIDDLQIHGTNPRLELSVNQIGFDPDNYKSAVAKLVNYDKKINSMLNYKIISLTDNKVKYKGSAKPSDYKMGNAQYWILPFDSFKTPGKYKLQAALIVDKKRMTVESYAFEIEKNILTKKLGEPLFYYIKSTRYPTNTKHFDPVPGAYIDTEFDREKWMESIPTWQWGMSHLYSLLEDKKIFSGYDPEDEIKYVSKFCLDMQDKKQGYIYEAVNVRPIKGIWPLDLLAENDTNNLYLNKNTYHRLTTQFIIGMIEAYKVFQKKDPSLAEQYLESAIFAWEYLSKKVFSESSDMGMYICDCMVLYNTTKDHKYLEAAKKASEKLLPLQFLDYSLNDQNVFGKFFGNHLRKDFNYQYKFVHSIGMFIGLLDLAEVLNKNDPLREKIMFHLDCFAYGYLKQTTELNPYGVVAQALEIGNHTGRINLNFFISTSTKYHGLNCDILAMGLIALKYSRLTKNPLFTKIAVDQIDWVLGKNPFGFCMVSGVGEANPPICPTDYNVGPVRGGVVNGIISDVNGIPKWSVGCISSEYWKPHSAMMLGLIAELESDLLENPNNYPQKPFDIKELYKKIDQYLEKTDNEPNGLLFYNTRISWSELCSDDMKLETSFVDVKKKKVLKMEYTSEKSGTWAQVQIDARAKINLNSIFAIRLKSSQDQNATLEVKVVDNNGSAFWKKIPCSNLSKDEQEISFNINDFKYAWGPNKKLENIQDLSIAISCSAKTTGYIMISEIKEIK